MKLIKILVTLCFINLPILCEELSSNITIIGLGRLGLCTALCFERAGFNVLGIDINPAYVEKINQKQLASSEPLVSEYLSKSTRLQASTSLEAGLEHSDIFFIIVDTPSGSNEPYDHSKLSKLLANINEHRVKNKSIVICCTIFPGYINTVAKTLMADCENITISYNPEFIAQGNIIHNFENPDIVLIGEGSKEAGDIIEKIYHSMCTNTPYIARMSPASAEIAKLAINCFLTTKIAYANMVGDIADKTIGANKYDILRAVGADSRIGSKYLQPGYGFGGPCFPRDNRALANYAEKIGIDALIPRATDAANKYHTKHMADELLKTNQERFVFEDVNYKPSCPVVIIEESQKLAVAQILAKAGKTVVIRDKVNTINEIRCTFGGIFQYEIIDHQ